MAERKSINKYYPPDWDPSKGSINTYRGQHHLRDRAKKLDQGILIVRFEMPFSVWCLGCNSLIGMGVRFNAEKKTIGKYFTTNILSFKMTCHQCGSKFEIETDPKNTDYKIKSGLRKRISEFDPKDAETVQLTTTTTNDDDDGSIDNNDNETILLKLENKKKDIQHGKESATQLERLQQLMGNRSLNDYKLSSIMRKNFRENKKEEQEELSRQQSKGIIIPLLKEQQDDIDATKEIDFKFNELKRKLDETKKFKRDLINNEPIIKPINKTTTTTTTTTDNSNSNSKLENILKKKSRIDPSLFKNKNDNNQQSKVNNVFSSNLFK